MINSELKGLNWLLLLVFAVAGLLPLNQNNQKHGPKIMGPCNSIFVLCLYKQKHGSY